MMWFAESMKRFLKNSYYRWFFSDAEYSVSSWLITTSSRHHIENLWVIFHELSLHAFQKPLVFLLHRNFWLRKILHRFCRFQVFLRIFSFIIFKNVFFFISYLSRTLSKITFFEIRFKSDWIESRQNESIIRQTVIVHADMTVGTFLRHRIQGYVKLLIPYVSLHEVLGPLLDNMASCCRRQDMGDRFHDKYPLPTSINQTDLPNRCITVLANLFLT